MSWWEPGSPRTRQRAAALTLSGKEVLDWINRRTFDCARPSRFGNLGFQGAGLESYEPSRAYAEFEVLGPLDFANSLELAQVVIEQIALLPDAHLLAQTSLQLRITGP